MWVVTRQEIWKGEQRETGKERKERKLKIRMKGNERTGNERKGNEKEKQLNSRK
jgi:hypothetical protein